MSAPRGELDGSLEDAHRNLLERIAAAGVFPSFYLAGSAALALHLGHRAARGLDLMSADNDLAPRRRRDLLQTALELEPRARVETARDGYLFLRWPGGLATKLFFYPYPAVETGPSFRDLPVASLLDLGLMKLGAIISRGTKRDFVDLFFVCRRLPFDLLLERSGEKFPHVVDFPLQALKGLADLSEARLTPMPELFEPVSWDEVEDWSARLVADAGRRHVGLADDRP